ncbi:hypothetical protein PROFUN_02159 [Planoprotostelium fungivorum]|uniref:Protein kinase domain-containing protein n=1 Tax=Planoprotostelium fungivorum TaxID=1890364 RepID=A0A2P6NZ91_9EUKA|nr:hypothetical protein PROFUN_02159 [Planoprotostelium fungivorum]
MVARSCRAFSGPALSLSNDKEYSPHVNLPEGEDKQEIKSTSTTMTTPHAHMHLEAVLGSGSNAVVYEARDATGKVMAVKRIDHSPRNRRVQNEIRANQMMSGVQGVCPYRGYQKFEKSTCLLFDKIYGKDMFSVLEHRKFTPLPERRVRKMMSTIAGALAECHRRGIAHRDVKLENIMLDEEDNAFLIDFGLVSFLHTNSNGLENPTSDICGSAEYSAPEILRSGPVNATSLDAWSLGVTAFALLYGAFPYSIGDLEDILLYEQHVHVPESGRVSEDMRERLTRLLWVDPKKRAGAPIGLNHKTWAVSHRGTDVSEVNSDTIRTQTGGRGRSFRSCCRNKKFPEQPNNMSKLTVRRSSERGHADHGWLNSYHTFSFAMYYDSKYDQFGTLRVINEDRVSGGKGFGTHPHKNFEIFSYVLAGTIEHRDGMGNREILKRGDVQFTSAGAGISHSEYNHDPKLPLYFLQIWVQPDQKNLKPEYQMKTFSEEKKRGQLLRILTPKAQATQYPDTITINQDMHVFASILSKSQTVHHNFPSGRQGYIHLAMHDGGSKINVNGQDLSSGDGLFITNTDTITITSTGEEDAEFLLFDMKQ